MKIGSGSGNKETFSVIQGTERVAHTMDDVAANVLTEPALFCVKDDSVTGDIMVVLWGEPLASKAVMDAQKADSKNILVKKIYLTGTTILQTDFFLLK